MPSTPLIIYFNTKCPVCDTGVRKHEQFVQLARQGLVEWRDINLEPDALQPYGVGIEAVRKRLHAISPEGQLLVGAAVVAALCRITPGQAWLGWLMSRPVIRTIAAFVYDSVAEMLYGWNRRKGHW